MPTFFPWLRGFIDGVLGPISIVLGTVTVIPILWTWWEVTFGRERQHRRWFEEVRRSTGERPAIFVFDLWDKGSIRATVEKFVGSQEGLRDIPEERRFIVERTGRLQPQDMPALARELRGVADRMTRAGTDTLHVFYAGPIVPMALIGAEFANSCQVILYQHNQEHSYSNWGPLRHYHV